MEVKVLKNILKVNQNLAAELRENYKKNDCFVINMLSSPGAGKTTVIIETIKRLPSNISAGVIVGDLATAHDAERINTLNIPVLQLNTDSGCHLDANMIKSAIPYFNLKDLDLLIIENVGNLVCPASFDLGEEKRIIILSIPEGDEKISKYPVMFNTGDILLLNKTDLIDFCDFNIERVKNDAENINPDMKLFEISAKTGKGFDKWVDWLKDQCLK